MTDLFQKFIIEGDSLILSKVAFHKELATDLTKVKGGGMFRFDPRTNTFLFFGGSYDFGPAKLEDIKECVMSGKVFSNRSARWSIASRHNFGYLTGTEIISLTTKTNQ